MDDDEKRFCCICGQSIGAVDADNWLVLPVLGGDGATVTRIRLLQATGECPNPKCKKTFRYFQPQEQFKAVIERVKERKLREAEEKAGIASDS